jgi:glycosyltransferase involved in cell wall biosynthesis
MKYADAVIGNTAAAVAKLEKKYPGQAQKIHLIWNGYDPEEEFVARSVTERPWRTITHAGNLYGGRHPGQLLKSVSRLAERNALNTERLRIRLLGYVDPEAPWIAEYDFAKFERMPWLGVVGQIPRPEAQMAMAESDYLLLLDLNERGSGLQVPGKLFEYLRIGRPILAFTSKGSQTEFILERSGIPHACIYPSLSDEETDRRFLSLLEMSPEPTSPSPWFQRTFDGSLQAQDLASILASLD